MPRSWPLVVTFGITMIAAAPARSQPSKSLPADEPSKLMPEGYTMERFLADLHKPLPAPPPPRDPVVRAAAEVRYRETVKILGRETDRCFGPSDETRSKHPNEDLQSMILWMERALDARLDYHAGKGDALRVLNEQKLRLLRIDQVMLGVIEGVGSSIYSYDLDEIRLALLDVEFRLAKLNARR